MSPASTPPVSTASTTPGSWQPGLPTYSISSLQSVIARETDRKKSLEQRGVAVVTASSAFVTLIFAIVAHAVFSANATFRDVERYLLVASLAFFGLSALVAAWTNQVDKLGWEDPTVLAQNLRIVEGTAKPDSSTSFTNAMDVVVELLSGVINRLHEANNDKASWLYRSIWLQLIAILFLAVSAGFIMARVN